MTPKLKLYYFDIDGRGQPIRLMLKLGKIPFDDIRIPVSEWDSKKPTMPFKQVPVLEVDGIQIAQTLAIAKYVAKLAKFYPESEIHEALADCISQTIDEYVVEVAPIYKTADDKKKEVIDQCFSKLKDKLPILDEYIKKHSTDGKHVVGSKPTYADFLLFSAVSIIQGLIPQADQYMTRNCATMMKIFQSMKTLC